MKVVPTAFGTEGVRMIVHLKQLLDTPELAAVFDPGDDKKNPPKDSGWLWTLKDLRNQGIHEQIIRIQSTANFHEDVNTPESRSGETRVYLLLHHKPT
jgi:hypothetical protein